LIVASLTAEVIADGGLFAHLCGCDKNIWRACIETSAAAGGLSQESTGRSHYAYEKDFWLREVNDSAFGLDARCRGAEQHSCVSGTSAASTSGALLAAGRD